MDVRGLRLDSRDLTLCLRALLQFRHLLTLDGRRRNLLTEDDVANLTGSEGSDVHAVTLAEVLHREH